MRSTRTRKRRRSRRDKWVSLRRTLLRRRQELLGEMHGELASRGTDAAGASFNDVADQASRALCDELAQGFAEIATANLRMIDRALERIEKRTYGRCENCGKAIPVSRLRALPFAELCVECKREEEAAAGEGPLQPPAPPPPFLGE